jgi:hypothetical protein
MNGNRWPDVCALCDRAIDMAMPWTLHRYLGAGWVHGGGREYIPVHHVCAYVGELDERGLLDDADIGPGWIHRWRHITTPGGPA